MPWTKICNSDIRLLGDAANGVRCASYKEALRAIVEGSFTKEKKDSWDKRLETVFNRGFWDGYYQGQTLGEWNSEYGSSATERKVFVGCGVKYFSKIGVAEFEIQAGNIRKGERLMVTGPTTGIVYFTADEIRYDLQSVDEARKGQRVSMKVNEKIRPSDKLFKILSAGEVPKVDRN